MSAGDALGPQFKEPTWRYEITVEDHPHTVKATSLESAWHEADHIRKTTGRRVAINSLDH